MENLFGYFRDFFGSAWNICIVVFAALTGFFVFKTALKFLIKLAIVLFIAAVVVGRFISYINLF